MASASQISNYIKDKKEDSMKSTEQLNQDVELSAIIEKAYVSSNALITKALDDEKKFRKSSHDELSFFMKEIKELNIANPERDLEKASSNVIEKMEKDTSLINSINENIKNYSPGKTVTWAL